MVSTKVYVQIGWSQSFRICYLVQLYRGLLNRCFENGPHLEYDGHIIILLVARIDVQGYTCVCPIQDDS